MLEDKEAKRDAWLKIAHRFTVISVNSSFIYYQQIPLAWLEMCDEKQRGFIYNVGWETCHFEDMDTGNNDFVGRSDRGCDVGLGLMMMQEVEDSCSNKSFVALDQHSSASPSSCYVEGFDGRASGCGGPIVCNTSNQKPCRGDIYDVVGAASASASAAVVLKSLHHHSFSADPSFAHNFSGKMTAPVNARVPFTAAQCQELERQTMIFKYMMASVLVPAELLIPINTNPSNVSMKGVLEMGFSSNSSDPEPWRCRRTDGKKWRCSRDVAPDQKYCERHSHKSRPRSRKPVELPNHSSNNNSNDHKMLTLKNMASDGSGTKQPHQSPHFTSHNNDVRLFTSSFDQPRCLEWFVKGETTVPFASNSNTEWQQFKAQGTNYGGNASEHHQLHLNEQFSPSLASLGGSLNLNQTHSQDTRAFISAWSTADREVVEMDGIGSKRHVYSNEKLPLSSLTLSMWGGNENNREEDDENSHEITETISWMGSSPGGPLAEALCLGIATSQTTSSCSKST
ncbi:growth-regulating factor 8-like [Hibiscus syriacus]|uniref:growth-regulating factor 8-like n=1 Tax=Hibiscus syriacus TaxID=106335 RepID=UPI00192134A2|nr:growth-regulating factor 8-like [Hibiscus syriacus]